MFDFVSSTKETNQKFTESFLSAKVPSLLCVHDLQHYRKLNYMHEKKRAHSKQ